MHIRMTELAMIALLGLSTSVAADTTTVMSGDDTFVAGAAVNENIETAGDVFVTARTASINGASQGDTHIVGFDVTVNSDTQKDLYAIGNSVLIRGTVAEDLTVAGFSVRTEVGSETAGNARLLGNSIVLEGPVSGAVLATAQDVILNAPIGGDARIVAKTISFGPEASVKGTLTYVSKEKITVPERVAPAERVVFEEFKNGIAWDEMDKVRKEMPGLPTFASMFFGFIVSLLFFMALGALMLGFMPKRLEEMRRVIARGPGRAIILGLIGLSILFGLVPITGLTIVGLPFVPVVLLALVVAWILGYALGAYSIAMRIWAALGGEEDPSNLARLLVFAAAITFIALLNYIPFVGWVANYTLVLLGIGGMTNRLFHYMIGSPDVVLDVDMKPIEN